MTVGRDLWAVPVLIVVGLAMVVGASFGAQYAVDLIFHYATLTRILAATLAGLVGYVVFVRLVERRRVVELGWPGALPELAAGLALGAGVFSLTIGTIWWLGGVEFDGLSPLPDVTHIAAISLMSGVVEELAIRGVVFRLLQRGLGSWVALGLSALLFGGLHMTNPGATWLAAVAIALEAGVMLAAAYMATGRLWLPIGLHIGWNFTQAGVFGVALSGVSLGGWLQSRPIGPDWLSGGDFGAEASVVAVVWCVALGVALLVLAGRRGRIVGAGRN